MQDDNFTDWDDARRGRLPRPRRSLSSRGAIYHLSVRTSSRAKGQSARAAAAYIQRTAEYRRDQAEEVVYTESGHMPGWAEAEPTAYWDAADLYERANGRLCKTLEFALPLALSAAERRELAVGFAHHLTDGERLPYTLAIHAGAGTNPHCHLLISERGNDGLERAPEQWFRRFNAAAPEQGGARKSTALHPKAWLEETRAVWAEQTNQALELAGHAVRIDHRSLEAQGAARVPRVTLGPRVQALEEAGLETEVGAEARRREQVNAELAELTRAQEEVEHERPRPGTEREPGRAGVDREGEDVGREARGVAGGDRRGADHRLGAERGAGRGAEPADRAAIGPGAGDVAGGDAESPQPSLGLPRGGGAPDRPPSPSDPALRSRDRAVAAGPEPGHSAGGSGERAARAAHELGWGDGLGGSGAAREGAGRAGGAPRKASGVVERGDRSAAGADSAAVGGAASEAAPGEGRWQVADGAVEREQEELRAQVAATRAERQATREQVAATRETREQERERKRERERERDEGLER